ncbi:ABC transporter permease [Methanolobus sp. ZRKC2]|uniref:ABC transporter permease n=1 Tax=Methanolobus sp. ZRKC2 TaxID=3125783 RepID=UPI003245BE97
MKPAKIFKISLNMVKANKLRSWLTIIGIIIGIASVMTVVTIGDYFQDQVTGTLEDLGSSVITIVPNTPFSTEEEDYVSENETSDSDTSSKLTKKDVQTLKRITEVQYIGVLVETYTPIKIGSEVTTVAITGVDPKVWSYMTTEKIAQGRILKPGDRNVVVISDSLANEAFKNKKIMLNQMIPLNGNYYRVVGILEKKKGLLGGITGMFGSSIYMPYEDVYNVRGDTDKTEKEYDYIEVKLHEGTDVKSTVDDMEQKMLLSRRVNKDNKDFYIFSPENYVKGTRTIVTGLTAFLAFIAGISLLVGSVGVANTMFTSVLEKTKEIGIMKAIGARNEDILAIFLCNAALIGLVGGIIGIIVGITAVQIIVLAVSMKLGVPFEFTLSLKATIIATIVSIIVGLIAGFMPAKNASKLNPVDALRYD